MNAIGLIELNSMARGIEVWDIMLKAASVELISATTLCPGKYMILIGGNIGAVKTSIETGLKKSDPWIVDSLIIPNLHEQIFPALTESADIDHIEALGIVETFSVSSAIMFADTAVKTASIKLIQIQIAMGLGGKATIYLTGEVGAVESAVEGGRKQIKPDMLTDSNIIASPHISLIKELNINYVTT